MQYQTVLQPTIHLSGISVQLSNSQKRNYEIITNQWLLFNNYIKEEGYTGGKNWRKYGVILKNEETYNYFCAVDKLKLKRSFQELTISGGVFARFQHIGSMHKLSTTYHKIYKDTIPNSKLRIDKDRTIIQYENYDHRFNWNKQDSIMDIYIPVIT